MAMTKPKPTPHQRALKHLAHMQRLVARSERALIRAAIVGCVRRDPTFTDQREASSSGRRVDLAHEVAELRWNRNHLTWIESDLRKMERKAKRAAMRGVPAIDGERKGRRRG